MVKYVCDNCDEIDETKTRVEERRETYDVKGEPVTVLAKVRVCQQCKEGIFDETLDDQNVQAAYDIYRRTHKIISPAEIRALREKYGLSQRGLGAVLEWGPITIHRYETGSLPDEAHNQVLRLLQDPFNMAQLIKDNPDAFEAEPYAKILDRLGAILSEHAPVKVAEVLGQGSRHKASIFTGFLDFQPEILMEMIVFFAHQSVGVLKTKLNKLLWYADFAHYKHHVVSISGAAYSHHQYGPVPQNYEAFVTALIANGALNLEETELGTNKQGEVMIGHLLSATRSPRLSDLDKTATETLKKVHQHFAPMGSKRISDLSHKEEGYIATQNRELISYTYADVLKVDPLTVPKKKRQVTKRKPTKKRRARFDSKEKTNRVGRRSGSA